MKRYVSVIAWALLCAVVTAGCALLPDGLALLRARTVKETRVPDLPTANITIYNSVKDTLMALQNEVFFVSSEALDETVYDAQSISEFLAQLAEYGLPTDIDTGQFAVTQAERLTLLAQDSENKSELITLSAYSMWSDDAAQWNLSWIEDDRSGRLLVADIVETFYGDALSEYDDAGEFAIYEDNAEPDGSSSAFVAGVLPSESPYNEAIEGPLLYRGLIPALTPVPAVTAAPYMPAGSDSGKAPESYYLSPAKLLSDWNSAAEICTKSFELLCRDYYGASEVVIEDVLWNERDGFKNAGATYWLYNDSYTLGSFKLMFDLNYTGVYIHWENCELTSMPF